jgi:hypothetical protein
VRITNSTTGQTVTIRADNVVSGPEGSLLVEAMFSSSVDLTAPSANLAARLHPVKAQAFEWIVTGQRPSVMPTTVGDGALPAGEAISVIPDVEIHVNRREGGIVVRHFSEFLDRSKRLLLRGSDEDVERTTALVGFEPEAEPIVREMRDGSLLLIFGFMPPLVTESDPAKSQRFELTTFGTQVAEAASVPVAWDDRDVFVIPKPQNDTVERIGHFLASFWETRKRSWKFW